MHALVLVLFLHCMPGGAGTCYCLGEGCCVHGLPLSHALTEEAEEFPLAAAMRPLICQCVLFSHCLLTGACVCCRLGGRCCIPSLPPSHPMTLMSSCGSHACVHAGAGACCRLGGGCCVPGNSLWLQAGQTGRWQHRRNSGRRRTKPWRRAHDRPALPWGQRGAAAVWG
eukprot:scaffold209987_cov16-Tisochrysis_lutea.AAC.1